jgi:hypothetical protein
MAVAEHFLQSFLDVKETMNVMIKQPVSMQFAETPVVVD